MDGHLTLNAEGQRMSTCSMTGDVFVERIVQRKIKPDLNREGENAWNFEQETQDMLQDPSRLSEKDQRFLIYCVQRRIKVTREGTLVLLTDRQWGCWMALAARYTRSRHPFFATAPEFPWSSRRRRA